MTLLSLRMSVAVIDANPLLADGISALLGQDSSFAARAIILGENSDLTWHRQRLHRGRFSWGPAQDHVV